MMDSNTGVLILNANPLIDIGNIRAIDSVILNGRVFSHDQLDAMLTAVKKANESSRKINIDKYR
jgi:hypothetical protein